MGSKTDPFNKIFYSAAVKHPLLRFAALSLLPAQDKEKKKSKEEGVWSESTRKAEGRSE